MISWIAEYFRRPSKAPRFLRGRKDDWQVAGEILERRGRRFSESDRPSVASGDDGGTSAEDHVLPRRVRVALAERRTRRFTEPDGRSMDTRDDNEATSSVEAFHRIEQHFDLDGYSLRSRRQEEQDFIMSHRGDTVDVWYLVDMRWLRSWKRFVRHGGPVPGPIDNRRLCDEETGLPLPGLQALADYHGVNATVWEFWLQRYGGGPTVERSALDVYSFSNDARPQVRSLRPLPTRSQQEMGRVEPAESGIVYAGHAGLLRRHVGRQYVPANRFHDVADAFERRRRRPTENRWYGERLYYEELMAIYEKEQLAAHAAAVASSLPTRCYEHGATGDNTECIICFESYAQGDGVKTLPCLHSFHAQCIDTWICRGAHGSLTCPLCMTHIDQ